MVVQKDFKKKKAKVGRKVKSAVSTKINVKSKQIVLPSQHLGNDQHQGFLLQHVISQLKHSNEKNKLDGLVELESVLQKHQHEVTKHLATLVPFVFEMILSDESKTRVGAVGFLGRLFSREKDIDSLGGLLQLMVFFVCSALSSINKGVRRDGLLVLRDIVQRFNVEAQMEKVLSSLLLIAQDPALLLALHTNSDTNTAVSNVLGIMSVLPSSGTKNSKVSKKKSGEKIKDQRTFLRGQADSQHIKKTTFACLLDALLALYSRKSNTAGPNQSSKETSGLLVDCRIASRPLCVHSLPMPLSIAKDMLSSSTEDRTSTGTAARLVRCLLQHFIALGRGGDGEGSGAGGQAGHSYETVTMLHRIACVLLSLLQDSEVRGLVLRSNDKGSAGLLQDLVCEGGSFPFYVQELAQHNELDAQYATYLLAAEQLNLLLCELGLLLSLGEITSPASIPEYLADLVSKCHKHLHGNGGLPSQGVLGEAHRQLFSSVLTLSAQVLAANGANCDSSSSVFVSSLVTTITSAISSTSPSASSSPTSPLSPLLLSAACQFVDCCVPVAPALLSSRSVSLLVSVYGMWTEIPKYLNSHVQTQPKYQVFTERLPDVVRCMRHLLLYGQEAAEDICSVTRQLATNIVAHLFTAPFLQAVGNSAGLCELLVLLVCLPTSHLSASLFRSVHALLRSLDVSAEVMSCFYGVMFVCVQGLSLDVEAAGQVLTTALSSDLAAIIDEADLEGSHSGMLHVVKSSLVGAIDAGILTVLDAYAVLQNGARKDFSSSREENVSMPSAETQLHVIICLLRNYSSDEQAGASTLLSWVCGLCDVTTRKIIATIAQQSLQAGISIDTSSSVALSGALQYAAEKEAEKGLQSVEQLLVALFDLLAASASVASTDFYSEVTYSILSRLCSQLERAGHGRHSLSLSRLTLDVFSRLFARLARHVFLSKVRLGIASVVEGVSLLMRVVREGRERASRMTDGDGGAMLLAVYAEMEDSISALA